MHANYCNMFLMSSKQVSLNCKLKAIALYKQLVQHQTLIEHKMNYIYIMEPITNDDISQS